MTHPATLFAYRPVSTPDAGLLSLESGYFTVRPEDETLVAGPLSRLHALTALADGWNAGKGRAIAAAAILATAVVLMEGTVAFRTTPDIMPLSDAGVLLEWEQGSRVLQIRVSETGESFYGAVSDDELEDEGRLTFKVSDFASWLMAAELAYA